MGKIFYASHAEKDKAQILADRYARKYKKGVCYTPSSRIPKSCKFDEVNRVWICYSAAHHHYGSCGSKEIHRRGNGTEWEIDIPVITWSPLASSSAINSMPLPTVDNEFLESKSSDETYENARPEDYVSLDE